jgi:hypothetical protein
MAISPQLQLVYCGVLYCSDLYESTSKIALLHSFCMYRQLSSFVCLVPDVLHSINEARTTFPTDHCHGSEKIIDQWLPAVMEEANLKKVSPPGSNPLDGLQQCASNLIKM